jgi:hypothetical protein
LHRCIVHILRKSLNEPRCHLLAAQPEVSHGRVVLRNHLTAHTPTRVRKQQRTAHDRTSSDRAGLVKRAALTRAHTRRRHHSVRALSSHRRNRHCVLDQSITDCAPPSERIGTACWISPSRTARHPR